MNKFITIAQVAALAAAGPSLSQIIKDVTAKYDQRFEAVGHDIMVLRDLIEDNQRATESIIENNRKATEALIEDNRKATEQSIMNLANEQVLVEAFYINDEFEVPGNNVETC